MAKDLCIITGASRGLGQALALQALARGQRVLCMARQTSAVLNAAAAPGQLEQWALDLSAPLPAAERLQTWLKAELPDAQRIYLINNAAQLNTPGPLHEQPLAELSTALRVSLEATLLLCAAFLASSQGHAGARRVLNISSGLGRRAMAGSAAYCCAKAGMDHLTRALALEQAQLPNGAQVLSLAPGVIATDMQLQLRSADPQRFAEQAYFQALHSEQALASPADCAAAIWRLLDSNSYATDAIGDLRQLQP